MVEGTDGRLSDEIRLVLEKDCYFIVLLHFFFNSLGFFSWGFSVIFLKLQAGIGNIFFLYMSKLFPFWSPHFFFECYLGFYSRTWIGILSDDEATLLTPNTGKFLSCYLISLCFLIIDTLFDDIVCMFKLIDIFIK